MLLLFYFISFFEKLTKKKSYLEYHLKESYKDYGFIGQQSSFF